MTQNVYLSLPLKNIKRLTWNMQQISYLVKIKKYKKKISNCLVDVLVNRFDGINNLHCKL